MPETGHVSSWPPGFATPVKRFFHLESRSGSRRRTHTSRRFRLRLLIRFHQFGRLDVGAEGNARDEEDVRFGLHPFAGAGVRDGGDPGAKS
ncbi:MAG: hypothetical protein V3U39_10700, partial [Acidimicrobiia bacterium]